MSKIPGVSMDLGFLAHGMAWTIRLCFVLCLLLGWIFDPLWYLPAAVCGALAGLELYFRYVQTSHGILRNFGVFGGMRYLMESVGPELRQYWIASDTEEKPFSRRERGEVYQYAKETLNTAAFGTLETLDYGMIRHSMYPITQDHLVPYQLTFGEERQLPAAYTITKPFLISGMSFGALGAHAVRALARGAKRTGIPMNTGEGGYPKYHLMEEPDLIFQMGTAKFGVRTEDGLLAPDKLQEMAALPSVRMIEIKLSQGAKPGKGGFLPGAKVSEEIAKLRGVPVGRDIHSPPGHPECDTADHTVQFIRQVQEISGLPVGVKFCLGREDELRALLLAMQHQQIFPDYMALDGAEGGTGAAPRSFMDYVGVPLFRAMSIVTRMLEETDTRSRMKLLAGGKLINPARQIKAFAYGADAVYTARGFLLALGCIQALQCNAGTCPVGITTQDPKLQRGLDIEIKARRVVHYVENLSHGLCELAAATGCRSFPELSPRALFNPWEYD
jgi:glutamate synthase domain-containing protein 2